MTEHRQQPQTAMELVTRWRAFHNSVRFVPTEDHTEFHLGEYILVEWISGREDPYARGFWISFDDNDVVHKVTNVVPSMTNVQGDEVLTNLRIETDDGFSVTVHLDPLTLARGVE